MALFEKKETGLSECYELQPVIHEDMRGKFVKTFHASTFAELGLSTNFKEEFYSLSHKNVLRGMHFQLPPHDHMKLVYCIQGSVYDYILDLRRNSATFGEVKKILLNDEKSNMLYIPSGMAHGFFTLSEKATLVYKVTSEYAPNYDSGILWSSLDLNLPAKNPIVSERDSEFVAFSEFDSPF